MSAQPQASASGREAFTDADRARIQNALQVKLGVEHMSERAGPGNRCGPTTFVASSQTATNIRSALILPTTFFASILERSKLTYVESWQCIKLANDTFGFNGWSSSIKALTQDFFTES